MNMWMFSFCPSNNAHKIIIIIIIDTNPNQTPTTAILAWTTDVNIRLYTVVYPPARRVVLWVPPEKSKAQLKGSNQKPDGYKLGRDGYKLGHKTHLMPING